MDPRSSQSSVLAVSVEGLSPHVQDIYHQVEAIIRDDVMPLEAAILEGRADIYSVAPKLKALKMKAKQQGLWNLFLPQEADKGETQYGAGLTNMEYAHICELMGQCRLSPPVFNCQAPNSGNIEVLVRYGTEEQKRTWLLPMLEGTIQSCFAMTEPEVASSDATNIQTSIRREGNEYVINGRKWWITGALHPDCKLCILLGRSDGSAPRHGQHSIILVPMDAPGVRVLRSLHHFGFLDEPGCHAELTFTNVRVPVSNLLLSEGRGFEIAQGRLGPARIHHCMRLIGHAERSLQLMLQRTLERTAFGQRLAEQGTIQVDVAMSRMEIEQARLLVLKAAHCMDVQGNKVAAPEIAMIKVVVPNMAMRVIDRAIQAFGAAGVSSDFALATMFAYARTMRIADGPDEVHIRAVARTEYANHHRHHQHAKL